jgi:hypothetical protein
MINGRSTMTGGSPSTTPCQPVDPATLTIHGASCTFACWSQMRIERARNEKANFGARARANANEHGARRWATAADIQLQEMVMAQRGAQIALPLEGEPPEHAHDAGGDDVVFVHLDLSQVGERTESMKAVPNGGACF